MNVISANRNAREIRAMIAQMNVLVVIQARLQYFRLIAIYYQYHFQHKPLQNIWEQA